MWRIEECFKLFITSPRILIPSHASCVQFFSISYSVVFCICIGVRVLLGSSSSWYCGLVFLKTFLGHIRSVFLGHAPAANIIFFFLVLKRMTQAYQLMKSCPSWLLSTVTYTILTGTIHASLSSLLIFIFHMLLIFFTV